MITPSSPIRRVKFVLQASGAVEIQNPVCRQVHILRCAAKFAYPAPLGGNRMAGDINVYVVRRPGRKFFYLRYLCPITGERFEKSSGETSEKDARKRAGEWELELKSGGGRRAATVGELAGLPGRL